MSEAETSYLAVREEAADAVRRLIALMRMRLIPQETVKQLTAEVNALIDDLERLPQLSDHGDWLSGVPGKIWDDRDGPIIGRANPVAPPLKLHSVTPGQLAGSVNWSDAYEGPRGCVHGGIVAAAFDELLGDSQIGSPGRTARLEIDFRAPTPLSTELTLHSEIESIDGRKTWIKGSITDGDRVCAEARGLFIEPRQP